jgi:hypothetical protein
MSWARHDYLGRVVTASSETLLPRASHGIGRAMASGELLPWAHCALRQVVASGESCLVCHVTKGAQRSAQLMKETDR